MFYSKKEIKKKREMYKEFDLDELKDDLLDRSYRIHLMKDLSTLTENIVKYILPAITLVVTVLETLTTSLSNQAINIIKDSSQSSKIVTTNYQDQVNFLLKSFGYMGLFIGLFVIIFLVLKRFEYGFSISVDIIQDIIRDKEYNEITANDSLK